MSLATLGASVSSTVKWAGASSLLGTTGIILRRPTGNEDVLAKPVNTFLIKKEKKQYAGPGWVWKSQGINSIRVGERKLQLFSPRRLQGWLLEKQTSDIGEN